MRKFAVVLSAPLALLCGAAWGAPYAVLYVDPDATGAVDVGSIRRAGPVVRYETVMIQRPRPELAGAGVPDELHHWKETDCEGNRSRILRMAMRLGGGLTTPSWAKDPGDWTEIDPAERHLLCESAPADTTFPSLEALRAGVLAAPAR